MDIVERACRKICEDSGIDPDGLLPSQGGSGPFAPRWQAYAKYVLITIKCMQEYKDEQL